MRRLTQPSLEPTYRAMMARQMMMRRTLLPQAFTLLLVLVPFCRHLPKVLDMPLKVFCTPCRRKGNDNDTSVSYHGHWKSIQELKVTHGGYH